MRRTNLVLDEHLRDEATRVLGAKTYSGREHGVGGSHPAEESTERCTVLRLGHLGGGAVGNAPGPSPANIRNAAPEVILVDTSVWIELLSGDPNIPAPIKT